MLWTFPHTRSNSTISALKPSILSLHKLCLFCLDRFKLEEGDLKYLDDARELIRPERNTLTVSFMDIEEHSTKLATLVQEHYYQ